MAKNTRITTGNCGEFYVASMLAGMGADVKVERVNAKLKDLSVNIGRHAFTVQVKTGRSFTNEERKRIPEESRWVWRVGTKCLDVTDAKHWYAFVYLGEWPICGDAPTVFFVPSKVVARTLRDNPSDQTDWFWMWKADAERYCGLGGLKTMMKMIRQRRKRPAG